MVSLFFDAVIALAGSQGPHDYFATQALSKAGLIIAADGGAQGLLRYGYPPNWVIGDFDSISEQVSKSLAPETKIIRFPKDKNYTDGELATAAAVLLAADVDLFAETFRHPLREIDEDVLYRAFELQTSLEGKSFVFVNYAGVRHDHTLANIALARRLAICGANVFLTDGTTLARIVSGPAELDSVFSPECFNVAREKFSDTRFLFSVQPLDDHVTGFSLKGLKWECDCVPLSLGRSLTLSNQPHSLYPDSAAVQIHTGTVMFFTFPEHL